LEATAPEGGKQLIQNMREMVAADHKDFLMDMVDVIINPQDIDAKTRQKIAAILKLGEHPFVYDMEELKQAILTEKELLEKATQVSRDWERYIKRFKEEGEAYRGWGAAGPAGKARPADIMAPKSFKQIINEVKEYSVDKLQDVMREAGVEKIGVRPVLDVDLAPIDTKEAAQMLVGMAELRNFALDRILREYKDKTEEDYKAWSLEELIKEAWAIDVRAKTGEVNLSEYEDNREKIIARFLKQARGFRYRHRKREKKEVVTPLQYMSAWEEAGEHNVGYYASGYWFNLYDESVVSTDELIKSLEKFKKESPVDFAKLPRRVRNLLEIDEEEEMRKRIEELIKRRTGKGLAKGTLVMKLVKVADSLDEKLLFKQADVVDGIINKILF